MASVTRSLLNFILIPALCAPVAVAAQTSPDTPSTVIHADTNLVVVDVVVTDAHRNPVRNLTASDFVLREDGQKQDIKTFEEHSSGESAKTPDSAPKLAPGIFTNEASLSSSGPLNLILLDKLNTPTIDQTYCQDQLAKFLKTAQAGTRIAVANLDSSRLTLLQGFTSDPALLRASLSGKGAAPGSPLFLREAGPSVIPAPQAELLRLNGLYRQQLTLDAINQLGRYLSQFHGRKNLIWFSASFPISIQPESIKPIDALPGLTEEFKETVNLMAHNQIALYPVDARGLVSQPNFSAAASSQGSAFAGIKAGAQAGSQFTINNSAQRFNMEDIADATGGKAFTDTNGLKEAVGRAIEAGSNYYSLTYTPANNDKKDKYRRIQIQLAHEGANLSYRRGYYVTDPGAATPHASQQTASAGTYTYDPLRTAMVRGGPEPAEIRFEADVRQSSGLEEATLAGDNHSSAKETGPFLRYHIQYTGQLRDVQCPANSDGAPVCALEFIAFVYNADGALINTQVNSIKTTVKKDYYSGLLNPTRHPEFRFRQEISVPVHGDYYLRLGVQDLSSDRVGALELPVAAVSTLTPLAAEKASASPPAKLN